MANVNQNNGRFLKGTDKRRLSFDVYSKQLELTTYLSGNVEEAIQLLTSTFQNECCPLELRLEAAKEILDRGIGTTRTG